MAKKKAAKTQPKYTAYNPFPTHVVTRDWEGMDKLNSELTTQVWRMRAKDPEGLYRSNQSGTWHSQDNFLEKTGDAGQKLKVMFAEAFGQWGQLHGMKSDGSVSINMAAWAMLYSDRGYAAVHTHPNCHVSAVYHVSDTTEKQDQIMATGVPVRSGDFEFVVPDHREYQLPFMQLSRSAVTGFQAGRITVFPSNLAHYVHPIIGEGERITIACNGTFLPPKEIK